MIMPELAQRIYDRAETKRLAGERVVLKTKAAKTVALMSSVSRELSKQSINKSRASGSSRAGQ